MVVRTASRWMVYEGPASESDEVDGFIWRVIAEDGDCALTLLRTGRLGGLGDAGEGERRSTGDLEMALEEYECG